jgi:hypothetical protein
VVFFLFVRQDGGWWLRLKGLSYHPPRGLLQLEDELLIRGEKCYGWPEGQPIHPPRLGIGFVG